MDPKRSTSPRERHRHVLVDSLKSALTLNGRLLWAYTTSLNSTQIVVSTFPDIGSLGCRPVHLSFFEALHGDSLDVCGLHTRAVTVFL